MNRGMAAVGGTIPTIVCFVVERVKSDLLTYQLSLIVQERIAAL